MAGPVRGGHGNGGTITGVARAPKEHALSTGGGDGTGRIGGAPAVKPALHGIQGLGAARAPGAGHAPGGRGSACIIPEAMRLCVRWRAARGWSAALERWWRPPAAVGAA